MKKGMKAVFAGFRKVIRDKATNEQGLTIVEVMVAFVLVLLAIAMITTATSMATKIQKKTQDAQKNTAILAEHAYQQLKPQYVESAKCWKTIISPSALSIKPDVIELEFEEPGNPNRFKVQARVADWTVTSGEAIKATYGVYTN